MTDLATEMLRIMAETNAKLVPMPKNPTWVFDQRNEILRRATEQEEADLAERLARFAEREQAR